MKIFASQISEVCDSFPKLSGLNSLTATNLLKKTDNGLVQLKESGLIGESIKGKDVIYFDLSFYETWLDIEMTLECGNRSYKIKFDLKVIRNTNKSDFENILINLGIKSWANIVANNYYALTQLIVNYPNKTSSENSKINSQKKQLDDIAFNNYNLDGFVSFDFDSKLTCKLIFTDIFEVVLDMLPNNKLQSQYKSISSLSIDLNRERKNLLKSYFNDIFSTWLLCKCDYVAMFNNIIWRYQPQTNHFMFDAEETSIDSSSLNISFNSNKETWKKSNIYHFDKRDSQKMSILKESNEFRMKSFQKQSSSTQINQSYKKEYHCMKYSIDYCSIINKYVLLYIPLKEFENKSPYTKNLVELSNGIIESFDIESKDSQTVYYKDDICLNSKRKWINRWVGIIGLIVIIILLIYVILC